METLLKDLLRLEERLKNLNPHSKMKCVITANSVGELAAVSQCNRFKKLKVYSPFQQSPTQDFFFFTYALPERPNTIIVVKAKLQ